MPNQSPTWSIILHAGARRIAKKEDARTRAVCLNALAVGSAILARRGSAVDAVTETMMELEKDPTCNAGYGSVLNADGEVEMDAAVMDGATLDIGAVAAIKGVRHPADVARRLLREPQVLLAAEGARRFARERGAELSDERDFARIQDPRYQRTVEKISDTVGCVAVDTHGDVAAGCSTGGLSGKPAGRVGDSPLPGAGFYADNAAGGASLSGIGERIARTLLAAQVMRSLETMDAQAAADDAIRAGTRVGGGIGVIVLDNRQRIGWAHDTPQFAVAHATSVRAPAWFDRRADDTSI